MVCRKRSSQASLLSKRWRPRRPSSLHLQRPSERLNRERCGAACSCADFEITSSRTAAADGALCRVSAREQLNLSGHAGLCALFFLGGADRGPFFRLRADGEHFQPGRVFLGSMPDQVHCFNVALLPIVLGEIDQTRTLRAEHVQAQA